MKKKLEFVRNDWRADNGIFSLSFPHLEFEELLLFEELLAIASS